MLELGRVTNSYVFALGDDDVKCIWKRLLYDSEGNLQSILMIPSCKRFHAYRSRTKQTLQDDTITSCKLQPNQRYLFSFTALRMFIAFACAVNAMVQQSVRPSVTYQYCVKAAERSKPDFGTKVTLGVSLKELAYFQNEGTLILNLAPKPKLNRFSIFPTKRRPPQVLPTQLDHHKFATPSTHLR